VREERDQAVEKLRNRYAAKITTLQDQIRRAQERVDREKSQYQSQGLQTVLSLGSTILRALMGRKMASSATVTGAASTARAASRAARERGDIGRADQNLEAIKDKLADLESQVQAEIAQIDAGAQKLELVEYPVRPRKSDITIRKVALAWTS